MNTNVEQVLHCSVCADETTMAFALHPQTGQFDANGAGADYATPAPADALRPPSPVKQALTAVMPPFSNLLPMNCGQGSACDLTDTTAESLCEGPEGGI